MKIKLSRCCFAAVEIQAAPFGCFFLNEFTTDPITGSKIVGRLCQENMISGKDERTKVFIATEIIATMIAAFQFLDNVKENRTIFCFFLNSELVLFKK